MGRFNEIKINDNTLLIDNNIINMLEILKLARETQLKIVKEMSNKAFKYAYTTTWEKHLNNYKKENLKLEYIEYKIKELERGNQ